MSDQPHKKRAADHQLTRDDDGEEDADNEFVTTPQIADAEELSARRMVKVRRPTGSDASGTAPSSTSGFFKDVATTATGTAAPAKPAFGFNFGSVTAASASGSTGDAPKPAFGFPTASTAAPMSFSFGATPSSASSADASAKPAVPSGFSFGAPSASGDAAKKPVFGPGSISFGGATATSGEEKKPAFGGFSFGQTKPATEVALKEEGSASEGKKPAEEKKPLFGAGTFNFGSAVNSFVAARTKMQEETKDKKPDEKEGGEAGKGADASDSNANADDEDKPDPAGFGSEIVEQTARDVLATAPSKLYLFEKGEDGKAGRWVERGTGEAKLISQPKTDNTKTHIYRLLVRGGYSLNATVGKNMFTLCKTEVKHLILLVATAEGPHTYLLKFTGPNAEANTTKFSDELRKVIEEVAKVA